MSERPQASIIISSYNYGRFLREAIESALNQTYPHTEVIVVDDGSSDNSREIIASYGNRIIPVLKENGGQASAFNAGFRISGGEMICFLDSDDALLATAMETAIECFDDPIVAKVHWPLWEVDEHSRRTGRIIPSDVLTDGDLREDLILNGPDSYIWPPTSGNAWSRRFLDSIFPMPEPEYITCPDSYLAVLAPLFGPIRATAEPQALYRTHGQNNMTKIRHQEMINILDCSCMVLGNYLRDAGISIDLQRWKSQPFYTWLYRIQQTSEDLETLIPPGSTFILVNEDQFRIECTSSRHAIPFLERDGEYWGQPPDDDTAIRELERLRQAGASFMAIAWPAFWWLEHYPKLHDYICSRFRSLLKNDRVVLFDLRA